MTYTFIKDPELIEESYQTEDLLNFSTIINDLKDRINKIKKNAIVGLIGPYGSGKSTMLYQIYKDKISVANGNKDKTNNNQTSENVSNQKQAQWFVFDAWQYPERKDLWEGFVLDIARQYNQELFKNTESQIEGNAERGKKAIAAAGVDVLATLIPGASALKNLPYFFQNSPIKKVYDFQELFLDIINKKIKKDIFIIIEDIDRSGDMGVFFLETLKYFIKTQEKNMKYKVIVIVPIGEQIWDKNGDRKVKDSYSKILDLNITFSPQNIDFTNFINEIFYVDKVSSSDPGNPSQDIVISHFRYLFENMILKEQQGTIRDIKSILRKTESNFFKLQEEHQKQIDIRLLILFTAIEYYHRSESEDSCMFYVKNIIKDDQYSKKYKEYKYLRGKFWGSKLFLMIVEQEDNMDSIKDISFLIQIDSYDNNSLKISKEGAFLMQDGNSSPSIYAINEVYFNLTQVTVNDITQN